MKPSSTEAAIGDKPATHETKPLQLPPAAGRRRSLKLPADTAVGCRGRAAADLLASVAMPMGNARLRMEASAASWTARADLLQRDEDDFEAQRKSGFDA